MNLTIFLLYALTKTMDCPVCLCDMTGNEYVIGCLAKHTICHSCEVTMRLKTVVEPHADSGHTFRPIKCPLCRGVETVPGKRKDESIQAEFNQVYTEFNRIIISQEERISQREQELDVLYQARERQLVAQYQARERVQQTVYARIANDLSAQISSLTREQRGHVVIEDASRSVASFSPTKSYCNKRGYGCTTRSKTPCKCTKITNGTRCTTPVCRQCKTCITCSIPVPLSVVVFA